MRANVLIPWERLPKRQKEAIGDYCNDVVIKEMYRESRILLDMYVKISCILQHDIHGHGEKRLTLYLGAHRMFFRRFKKLQTREEQIEYINARISEIFKNGFPQDYIDGLLDDNVTVIEE